MDRRMPFQRALSRIVVIVVLTLGYAAVAWSADDPVIPSGFLAYPPYNGFVFEAVHLLPTPQDHLTIAEAEDNSLYKGMDAIRLAEAGSFDNKFKQTQQRERDRDEQAKETALPGQLADAFKTALAASNGDVAFALGKDLPPAIRAYTAAAVDFRLAHLPAVANQGEGTSPTVALTAEQRVALDNSIPRFQAVLALSDADKRPRAVAAAYMLGRAYALRGASDDTALAAKAFSMTRTLAWAGLPDPDGLAVASFGEQARLRRAAGDLTSAVQLYAEQAARGSVEGVASLKWVAQALYDDPDGMTKVENSPLAQRLLIAYALERNDDGKVRDFVYSPGGRASGVADNGTIDRLLRAAKKWPRDKVAMPDRLAALAYRAGDFDDAQALIDGQETSLAWWIRAKLFMADGNLASAEKAYKKVVALTPATPDRLGLSPFNESAACGELAQLERARGEFVAAMRSQVACDATFDDRDLHSLTTYLAERVLSTRELRGIVDALPADPPNTTIGSTLWQSGSGRQEVRSALARRLVREGHYKEAIDYAAVTGDFSNYQNDPSFDTGLSAKLKTPRDVIQAYGEAHDRTEHAPSQLARAEAWYQLALLTRVRSEYITGHDSPHYANGPIPIFPAASSSEHVRLKQNYATPDQDRLHWFIAFDYAVKAAQLTPPHSQAYAAILCHAAHWMKQAPVLPDAEPAERLQRAWLLYVQRGAYVPWAEKFGSHCPDPDFAGAHRYYHAATVVSKG